MDKEQKVKVLDHSSFRDIVRQTMRHRRETGERCNDLIDLMLDCVKQDKETTTTHEEEEDQYERDMRLSSTDDQATNKLASSSLRYMLLTHFAHFLICSAIFVNRNLANSCYKQ
jgi:hypothetical protein